MRSLFKYPVLLLMLFSFNATAAGVVTSKIKEIMVDDAYSNQIFIKMEGSIAGQSECQTVSTWDFVFPLNSEMKKTVFVSMLLSAHAAGTTVELTADDDDCSTFQGIETLKRIELK